LYAHQLLTFFGVELDSKTTWVTLSISRTLLATDGRKPQENWGSLSNFVQELGTRVFCNVVGDFKETVSCRALGVDNSFWNALSVKAGQLVKKMVVLN
jgi:hypothetical protein